MSDDTPNPTRSAWTLPDRSLRKNRQHKRPKKPETLPHYKQVVLYVYQSRYATVDHIHQRFSHRIKTLRTAQYQLARLVDLGYLTTVDVTSTSPNFPYVYIVTKAGIRFLRQQLKLELSEAREEATSLAGITHELFLTAFELACYQTVKVRADLSLKFTERRYYHAQRQLHYQKDPTNDDKRRLIPDAGFLLSINRPNLNQIPALLFYFVELDNGTELANVVLKKFKKYVTWTNSPGGQQYLIDTYRRHGKEHPKANYRLLVIARHAGEPGQDMIRLTQLFTQALELPPDMQKKMWFATVDDLAAHESDTAPLSAPVWYRVADAETWLNSYQAFKNALPTGKGHRPNQRKYEYVAGRLNDMTQHSPLPNPLTT